MEYQEDAMEATEDLGQEESVDASNSEDEGLETGETPRSANADEGEGQAAIQEQKMDWEKSYKHLERKYGQDSQRLKKYESEYQSYQEKVSAYDKLEQMLAQNPRAVEALRNAMQNQGVDPEVAESPVYQQLRQQMQELQEMKPLIQEYQQDKIKQSAEQTLNTAESDAKELYKSVFGKDMSESEYVQALQWMMDNKIYSGKTAVRDLFFEQATKFKAQGALQANMAKKSMGVTRTQGMNSNSAAKPNKEVMSAREAWIASMEEEGRDTSSFQ